MKQSKERHTTKYSNHNPKEDVMKSIMWLTSLISILACIIIVSTRNHDFSKNCSEYLKLAGNAPTIEMADEFIGLALNYIESKNLTSGNSGCFLKTPKNDVGIWYRKIKGAKETTAALITKTKEDPASISQTDRDNALMNIKKVLLDNESSVILPDNIALFPNQLGMLILSLFSALSFFFAFGCSFIFTKR